MERIEKDRIPKRVDVGECAGRRSVGRPRERWIDNVKDCLRKRGLDVRQARRMVHDSIVWWGFVRGECMGCCPGDEPLALSRCANLMKPWKGGNPPLAKPTTYKHKREIFFFHLFLVLLVFYFRSFMA